MRHTHKHTHLMVMHKSKCVIREMEHEMRKWWRRC